MRYIFILLTIALLNACTIVPGETFNFGMTTGITSKDSPYIYIDSWADIKTGLITYKEPDGFKSSYETLINEAHLTINIDHELSVLSCTSEQIKKIHKSILEMKRAFNAEFLQNYHVTLLFVKDKNYHYSHRLTKHSKKLHFYMPYDDCKFLAQATKPVFYAVVHETVHVYSVQKYHGNTFNNLEQEYWANRLAQCAYIENIPKFSRTVSERHVFSSAENRYLQTHIYREMTGTTKLSASLSSNILNNDFLLHLQETKAKDLTSASKKQVQNWCKVKPHKFTARQIRRILANTNA
ncbi:MAG: hypothetical protein COB35_06005 [Gammaproteobacteria bacterium]|nr:MAG: hypothetical protein COB35_06005 [Gammaproteobacteria bacterium]